MELYKWQRAISPVLACLLCILMVLSTHAKPSGNDNSVTASGLWARSNLFAWCVVPFDANKRGPEERAQMLERLGFKHFAYDWRDKDVPTFDAEIEALQKHGIDLLAWWFPFDADDPLAKTTLETFKRHNVHPQLWVIQSVRGLPKTPQEWAKVLPPGLTMPQTKEEFDRLSEIDKAKIQELTKQLFARSNGLTKTPEEQEQRVKQEANRINALVRLAAPYGSQIELYNHNGWFGMEQNQLAIIARLEELGVTDVGMVYNFSHSRDELHDDSKDFPQLWDKMKKHTVAVNITGMHWEGQEVYPSQGDSELAMMRTVQDSRWIGPIGLIAEKGGDAEVTLKNYMIGLNWLAAEINNPDSGGERPFPPAK